MNGVLRRKGWKVLIVAPTEKRAWAFKALEKGGYQVSDPMPVFLKEKESGT